MASILPLPFLRPSALPRPSTITYILRATRSYEYNGSPTKPKKQPFVPRLLNKNNNIPRPILDPAPQAATVTSSQANKLYRVVRTPSTNYPIYHLSKAGGNRKLTRIKGIEGDLTVLRDELREALGVPDTEVVINQLTRHIVVKGHKRSDVTKFFSERGL